MGKLPIAVVLLLLPGCINSPNDESLGDWEYTWKEVTNGEEKTGNLIFRHLGTREILIADGSILEANGLAFEWRHYDYHLWVDGDLRLLRVDTYCLEPGSIWCDFQGVDWTHASSALPFGIGWNWHVGEQISQHDSPILVGNDGAIESAGFMWEVGSLLPVQAPANYKYSGDPMPKSGAFSSEGREVSIKLATKGANWWTQSVPVIDFSVPELVEVSDYMQAGWDIQLPVINRTLDEFRDWSLDHLPGDYARGDVDCLTGIYVDSPKVTTDTVPVLGDTRRGQVSFTWMVDINYSAFQQVGYQKYFLQPGFFYNINNSTGVFDSNCDLPAYETNISIFDYVDMELNDPMLFGVKSTWSAYLTHRARPHSPTAAFVTEIDFPDRILQTVLQVNSITGRLWHLSGVLDHEDFRSRELQAEFPWEIDAYVRVA